MTDDDCPMDEDEFRHVENDEYYSRRTARYSPHPDDRDTGVDEEEEEWLLNAIAEHEQSEMYEGMAEQHAKEMAAEDAKLADLECSQKLNVKGETT